MGAAQDDSAETSRDERLADLELFVRGMVHDLNNALNVIKTNLYLLRQRLPGEDTKLQRPLERIDDQVVSIRRLLDGHQALYQATEPAYQRTDLNQLVRSVVEAGVAPVGYNVRLDLAEDLPLVWADPRLLEAALRALFRNSVRAMGGSGEICVQTRAETDSAGVRLTVADTGPGFPEAVRERALEPFVSGWPDHAGLGLALVDRIARAHGGKATIESEVGQGARVTIELPNRQEA